jgi:hypothetical protein
LPRDCTITDISDGGVKLVAEFLEVPPQFTVIFAPDYSRQCRLRWRIGCEFGANPAWEALLTKARAAGSDPTWLRGLAAYHCSPIASTQKCFQEFSVIKFTSIRMGVVRKLRRILRIEEETLACSRRSPVRPKVV